ncbi:MAG TPA: hypothetical protein VMM92_00640, partial [Thermoanaerobaculia bacterium]|nr:hypothetical protein [Thermoanaerobaculia bacterium]
KLPGAQAAVGWTVRTRAFRKPTCTAGYEGGAGDISVHKSCASTVPCTNPDYCGLSRQYCCVEHGGTVAVGAEQEQFDDSHVPFDVLVSRGFLFRADCLVDGFIPDVTGNWGGGSSCNYSCTAPRCNQPIDPYQASPSGPLDFLTDDSAAQNVGCKISKGAVCGTGGVNNLFWNRANDRADHTQARNITIRDCGERPGAAFTVTAGKKVLCQTSSGTAATCDLGELPRRGLTITVTATASPGGHGQYELTAGRGVTISGEKRNNVNGTLARGSSVTYTLLEE